MLLLSAVISLTAPLRAQVLYGSLVGSVADPSVPGAQVRLLNMLTGVMQTTRSDAQGAYQFSNIQSRIYEVECTAQGFRPLRRTSIKVVANAVVRVDAALDVGEANQSVLVTAESPLLQSDNSDVHKDPGTKELTDLPVDGYRTATTPSRALLPERW
jgi:Carboxypeptidase regulatory-like domain